MTHDPIDLLREAAPYALKHHGKLFVLYLDSRLLDRLTDPPITQLVMDIALLNCFHIQLVVVFGVRNQLDRTLAERNMPTSFGDHDDWRVTDSDQLTVLQSVIHDCQSRIVALLRQALVRYGIEADPFDVLTDQRLVQAKAYGVQNGVDYRYTGVVSKIMVDKIRAQLGLGNIILLPPMAASSLGQNYNLRAAEVALAVAGQLHADKMIVVGQPIPEEVKGSFFHAEQFYGTLDRPPASTAAAREARLLERIVRQSIAHRVGRIHFLDPLVNDNLLSELFTHSGSGVLISCDPYEQFRPAVAEDLDSIVNLYQPAQEQQQLLDRNRQRIHAELSDYYVLLCDQIIIGCAALTSIEGGRVAEIHSLVIHPNYRQQGRGRRMVLSLIDRAKQLDHRELFCLTTQAQDFFDGLGMSQVSADRLPPERKTSLVQGRGSIIYQLSLNTSSSVSE